MPNPGGSGILRVMIVQRRQRSLENPRRHNPFRRFFLEKGLLFLYFIPLILAGSLILSLPGLYRPGALPYLDALFTAVSAVCVTGLITVNTADFTPLGQGVILLLIQMGGLGILTFATVYLSPRRRKISFHHRRILTEFFVDNVEYRPREIIRAVVGFTLGIELAGTLLLFPLFHRAGTEEPLFTAVFHAVSAFCNAGFSRFPDSLEGFGSDYPVQAVLMGLIITGGLGFVALKDVILKSRRRIRRLSLHTYLVLITSAVLWVSGAVIYRFTEGAGLLSALPEPEKWAAALFQSVTNRTAGFNVLPQGALSPLGRVLSLPFMFVGGASGSIAGGIKVTTLALVAAALFSGFEDRGGLALRGRRIPSAVLNRAFVFFIKALLILFTAFVLLLAAERHHLVRTEPLLNLLFETVSAFGTVGLSTGLTGSLTGAGKIIIIATMFAGRVGLFAIAMPMFRVFPDPRIDYPREEVLVG